MTKYQLIEAIKSSNLPLPLRAKLNEFNGISDGERYGIVVLDAGGSYFFLSNCARFDGDKSTDPKSRPEAHGYKYSYRNFNQVEITAIPTIGSSFEVPIISKQKTIIIEFDTFVSVNQNF